MAENWNTINDDWAKEHDAMQAENIRLRELLRRVLIESVCCSENTLRGIRNLREIPEGLFTDIAAELEGK